MGMDVIMDIYHQGKCLKEDIFNGRDREWFYALQDRTDDDLPVVYGKGQNTPIDYRPPIDNDIYHMNVGHFKYWYDTRKPYLNAGWTYKYDEWLWKTKGIAPDPEHIYERLDLKENLVIEEMVFIEYETYSSHTWLYNYLQENKIPDSADIVYWFSY